MFILCWHFLGCRGEHILKCTAMLCWRCRGEHILKCTAMLCWPFLDYRGEHESGGRYFKLRGVCDARKYHKRVPQQFLLSLNCESLKFYSLYPKSMFWNWLLRSKYREIYMMPRNCLYLNWRHQLRFIVRGNWDLSCELRFTTNWDLSYE